MAEVNTVFEFDDSRGIEDVLILVYWSQLSGSSSGRIEVIESICEAISFRFKSRSKNIEILPRKDSLCIVIRKSTAQNCKALVSVSVGCANAQTPSFSDHVTQIDMFWSEANAEVIWDNSE